MKNIKEKIIGFFISVVGFIVAMMYISGMYLLIANDKYSAKQLVAGSVFPPYAVYIGGKDLYNRVVRKNYVISDYVENVNKKLPAQINTELLLLSLQEKNHELIYTIKFLHYAKEDISTTVMKEVAKKRLSSYCYGKLHFLRDNNFDASFIYLDGKNEMIDGIILEPSDCD